MYVPYGLPLRLAYVGLREQCLMPASSPDLIIFRLMSCFCAWPTAAYVLCGCLYAGSVCLPVRRMYACLCAVCMPACALYACLCTRSVHSSPCSLPVVFCLVLCLCTSPAYAPRLPMHLACLCTYAPVLCLCTSPISAYVSCKNGLGLPLFRHGLGLPCNHGQAWPGAASKCCHDLWVCSHILAQVPMTRSRVRGLSGPPSSMSLPQIMALMLSGGYVCHILTHSCYLDSCYLVPYTHSLSLPSPSQASVA